MATTNKPNNGVFSPATYGDGVGIFIAKYIYTDPKVGVREVISNGADEYLNPDTHKYENYNCIYITINSLRRTFKCVDYAGGIKDIEDFKKFFRDKEPSKQVGDTISTLSNPDDNMIGYWHAGKASFLKMSRTTEGEIVYFRSNNGESGDVLIMMLHGEAVGWKTPISHYEKEYMHLAKPELGLTVEATNIVDDLLDLTQLIKDISKWFGIRIARGLKIFIRDEAIEGSGWIRIDKPEDLDTHEDLRTPELLLSNGKYITHHLTEIQKPKWNNIDIYVKHVYIKSIHIERKVHGWINCNSFQLNGPRDGFDTGIGTMYSEGCEKLVKYINDNFEAIESKAPKLTHEKDMNELLLKYLLKANIFEQEPICLSGSIDKDSKLKGEIKQGEGELGKWERKTDQKITNTGGNDDKVIVFAKNKREIPRKPPGPCPGNPDDTKDNPTYEDGGNKIIATRTDIPREQRGPIKPNANVNLGPLGEEGPISKLQTSSQLVLNEDRPVVNRIMKMPLKQMLSALGPLIVEAIAEFALQGSRPTVEEYRKKCADLYS